MDTFYYSCYSLPYLLLLVFKQSSEIGPLWRPVMRKIKPLICNPQLRLEVNRVIPLICNPPLQLVVLRVKPFVCNPSLRLVILCDKPLSYNLPAQYQEYIWEILPNYIQLSWVFLAIPFFYGLFVAFRVMVHGVKPLYIHIRKTSGT